MFHGSLLSSLLISWRSILRLDDTADDDSLSEVAGEGETEIVDVLSRNHSSISGSLNSGFIRGMNRGIGVPRRRHGEETSVW